ncbi:hypothetical protein PVAND_013405 [Polypedilum vanderplanki]|uniref:Odorant receptor n=1 Tax=Polypedilum vanderplanki TaxID=319348 RepID=A0A9J6CQK2_POLVA|nr:hypothetical protein PVAND_013405 [Polypedilum vanderplanki]
MEKDYSVIDLFKIASSYYKFIGINLFEFKIIKLQKRRQKLVMFLRYCYFFFCVFSIIALSVLNLMIQLSKPDEPKDFTFILSGFSIAFKSLYIFIKRRKFCEIILELQKNFKNTTIKKYQISDLLKYMRFYRICCIASASAMSLRMIVVMFTEDLSVIEDTIYVLYKVKPFYIFLRIWFLIIITSSTFVLFSNTVIIITFFRILAVAFENLNVDILMLNYENSENILVKKHFKILEFSKKLENLLSFMLLIHFGEISGVIGGAGIQVINNTMFYRKIIYFLLTSERLYQVLVICYFGQKIVNANKINREMLYNNMWYDWRNRKTKTLLLMLLYTQKCVCIKSLGLKKISLRTFMKVS